MTEQTTKPTVYIETTIVSYLTARPSRDIVRLANEIRTQEWWRSERATFNVFASAFVIEEVSKGDPAAAAERLAALQGIPMLNPVQDSAALAGQLIQSLALPRRAETDAAHIAVSAVHGIEFLLTWNCRHLANAQLAARIERTCNAAGFDAPRIVTPEQLRGSP
jgi:hypothetical protein